VIGWAENTAKTGSRYDKKFIRAVCLSIKDSEAVRFEFPTKRNFTEFEILE